MSVELVNVSRLVDGAATIRDVTMKLERGTLSVLLGKPAVLTTTAAHNNETNIDFLVTIGVLLP